MGLKKEQWTDFGKILKEFGYEIADRELDHLWQIVVNIHHHLQRELKKAIRKNLQLCYLLNEEKQVREVISPLLSLNYLFDQNFYQLDYEPVEGLRKFLKLTAATYGSTTEFIKKIRQANENLCFFRKDNHCSLIEDYRYLRKVPIYGGENEGYSRELITILNSFREIERILTEPDFYKRLREDVELFKRDYLERYKEEHHRFQAELREFNKALSALPEYRALEIFSGVKWLSIGSDLHPIKRYIDTFFQQRCQVKNIEEVLVNKPVCQCGFLPGRVVTIPSLEKLKPLLRKGISGYLEELQSSHNLISLKTYQSFNPDSRLAGIIEADPEKPEGIISLIDIELVDEINQALSKSYPLKISLNEVADLMAGTYPLNRTDLIGNEIEAILTRIVREKLAGVEEINYDNLFINLIK